MHKYQITMIFEGESPASAEEMDALAEKTAELIAEEHYLDTRDASGTLTSCTTWKRQAWTMGPIRVVVANNSCLTNDPCALCGQRCDPCGMDPFLAPDDGKRPVALVCDECAVAHGVGEQLKAARERQEREAWREREEEDRVYGLMSTPEEDERAKGIVSHIFTALREQLTRRDSDSE